MLYRNGVELETCMRMSLLKWDMSQPFKMVIALYNLCIITLVMNISHVKIDILWHVSSSTPFLYNIREPKYKQNYMGHQISRD